MNFHTFKNFFNKRIIDLNTSQIISMYLLYIVFISLCSIIYAYLINGRFQLSDINNSIIIDKIQFSYAGLIKNLVTNWEYSSILYGVKSYVARLPVLPIILSIAIKINSNIYFIFIFKNIIFFSLYFLSSFLFCKYGSKNLKTFIILILFSFIIPYNFHVGLSIFFADSIIYLILPSLFLVMNSNIIYKYYIISFFLMILYLSKTSMVFIVLIMPLLILILEKENLKKRIIPLLSVIIVIVGWGTFGTIKTGKFPILKSTISLNTSAYFFINCHPKFTEFYPYKSIDLLLPKNIDFSEYEGEWDVYFEYNKKIKSAECTKKSFFKDIAKKLHFIFLNINKDNVWPDEDGNFNNPIIYSYIFNKLFFVSAIVISFFIAIKNIINLNKFEKYKIEIYYLSIIVLNLLPHLAAWATAKHLVAIQLVSLIYLFLKTKFFFRSL